MSDRFNRKLLCHGVTVASFGSLVFPVGGVETITGANGI